MNKPLARGGRSFQRLEPVACSQRRPGGNVARARQSSPAPQDPEQFESPELRRLPRAQSCPAGSAATRSASSHTRLRRKRPPRSRAGSGGRWLCGDSNGAAASSAWRGFVQRVALDPRRRPTAGFFDTTAVEVGIGNGDSRRLVSSCGLWQRLTAPFVVKESGARSFT